MKQKMKSVFVFIIYAIAMGQIINGKIINIP